MLYAIAIAMGQILKCKCMYHTVLVRALLWVYLNTKLSACTTLQCRDSTHFRKLFSKLFSVSWFMRTDLWRCLPSSRCLQHTWRDILYHVTSAFARPPERRGGHTHTVNVDDTTWNRTMNLNLTKNRTIWNSALRSTASRKSTTDIYIPRRFAAGQWSQCSNLPNVLKCNVM